MKKILATITIIATLALTVYVETAQAAWYDNSWSNRVSVTVQSSQVDSNLSNFPVYVDLSDLPSGFHTNVKTDGCDIRVVESDETTETAFELVEYDSASDTGELHFLADSLSSSADTTFYIYYGNSGASCYGDSATNGSENVWTNGYVGVYHLQNGSLIDSTSNSNDLTSQGGLGSGDATAGAIAGDGITVGSGKYATLSDNTSMDWEEVTFSAWAQTATLAADGGVGAKNSGGSSEPLLWFDEGTNDFTFAVVTGGSGFINGSSGGSYTTRSINTWYYATGIFDGSEVRSLVNGSENFSASASGGISNTSAGFALGNEDGGGRQLDGKIDEFRMADTGRTNTWISAEYTNQNTPTTFYTAGTEESAPSGTTPLTQLIIDNGGMKVDNGRVIID